MNKVKEVNPIFIAVWTVLFRRWHSPCTHNVLVCDCTLLSAEEKKHCVLCKNAANEKERRRKWKEIERERNGSPNDAKVHYKYHWFSPMHSSTDHGYPKCANSKRNSFQIRDSVLIDPRWLPISTLHICPLTFAPKLMKTKHPKSNMRKAFSLKWIKQKHGLRSCNLAGG